MKTRAITFEEAKRLFVHRFTMEHVPAWAREPHQHSELGEVYYAPQYASDREWYERTEFFGEGELASRSHCYSAEPTWPMGRGFLSQPFHRGGAQLCHA